MNPQLKKLTEKIDALSLRERVILFATITLVLLFLVDRLLLQPQFIRQKQLAAQILQDQARMKDIQAGIQQKIMARNVDPDAANKARLDALKREFTQAQRGLMALHKGLVAPDRMSSLLEDILKRNDQLRLIGLKTLPVAAIGDSVDQVSGDKPGAAVVPTAAHIYKHGVELTIRGNYPAMLRYMAELEAMPWQLYLSKAALMVDEYPQATLTLTLFTLSLDRTWLNL